MKITLEFDSNNEDDMERYETMMKASKYQAVIESVRNEIFRPARKHGYPDSNINKLIEDCGVTHEQYGRGEEIISKLEEIWGEILERYEIKD